MTGVPLLLFIALQLASANSFSVGPLPSEGFIVAELPTAQLLTPQRMHGQYSDVYVREDDEKQLDLSNMDKTMESVNKEYSTRFPSSANAHPAPARSHASPKKSYNSHGHSHTSPKKSHSSHGHSHTSPKKSHSSHGHSHTSPKKSHSSHGHSHSSSTGSHTSTAKSQAHKHGQKGSSAQVQSSGTLKRGHSSNGQKKRPSFANIKHSRTKPSTTSSSGSTKCTTRRRVCGSTCRGKTNRKTSCTVQTGVPKICQKQVKASFGCAGENPKMCTHVEKEPSVCKRTRKRKVQCPDKKYSCDRKITERVPCRRAKNCKKWRSVPCGEHKKLSESRNCRASTGPCEECKGRFIFVKCKRRKWFRTAVPCPKHNNPDTKSHHSSNYDSVHGSKNPHSSISYGEKRQSKTSTSNPVEDKRHSSYVRIPFPDEGIRVASIRCFASFFEKSHCKGISGGCNSGDKLKFDAEKCTERACTECLEARRNESSTKLKVFCQAFSSRYCKGASSISASSRQGTVQKGNSGIFDNAAVVVHSSQSSGLCFKDESKIIYSLCEKKLPHHETCVKGCRLNKKCVEQGSYRKYRGYCKEHLPKYCYEKQKRVCTKTRKVRGTCTRRGKKNCDGKVTESYVCWKSKQVKRPCKRQPCRGIFQCAKQRFFKKCSSVFMKKYICGTKKETRTASCTQSTGSVCTPKYCTVKSCTSRAH